MKMRKSRVSMAVAAVLSAACLIPATSFGYSINLQGADAGTLNTDSRGDALLFPFYTVANGATTSISISNTDVSQVILAKVRIREQVHSMDALDFFVALSPRDKFDFVLSLDAGTKRPVMVWNDTSCVVGPSSKTQVFNPHWPGVVGTDEQLQAGHIEVMGLVALADTTSNTTNLRRAATHDPATGIPYNCELLKQVLADPLKVNVLNTPGSTYGTLEDAHNSLMGRYVITIPNQGLEGGSDAIALRDSNLADKMGGTANWHVTAQSGKYCRDLGKGGTKDNCRFSATDAAYYAWDLQEWAHPHLAELATSATIPATAITPAVPGTGLIAFQQGLSALSVAGDWSNNLANHVGFDWVITFPDKYTYLDCKEYLDNPNGKIPGTCTWAVLQDPKVTLGAPLDELSSVWYNGGLKCSKTATICSIDAIDQVVPVSLGAYDFEEHEILGGVGVSPGAPGEVWLANEVNVITLNNTALGQTIVPSKIQLNPTGSGDTRSWVRKAMEFDLGTAAKRGWAKLDLSWRSAEKPAAVTGIIFTMRATEDPTINNASLTELQKFTK